MSRIIYDFAGWIEVSEDTKFVHIETGETITAKEWKALASEFRNEYTLNSFIDAYQESDDGGITDSNLEIEED